MAPGTRTRPNILITGTPGTGKSSLTERLAQETGLTGVEVSVLAKEQELTTEYDEELDTHVIDEDKVVSNNAQLGDTPNYKLSMACARCCGEGVKYFLYPGSG